MIYEYLLIFISSYEYGYGHEKRLSLLKKLLNKKNKKCKLINVCNFKNEKSSVFKLSKLSNQLIVDVTNRNFLKDNKEFLVFIKGIAPKKKIIVFDSFDKYSINKNIEKGKNISFIIPYLFNYSRKKNFYNGLKYFLVPNKQKYIKKKINKETRRILISFGGSDLRNLSTKIIKKLDSFENQKLDVKILVGKFSKSSLIKKNLLNKHNVSLIKSNDIYKYFFWSDLSILSSGLSKYEAIYTRTPSIIVESSKDDNLLNKYLKKQRSNIFIKEQIFLNNFDYLFKKFINYEFRRNLHLNCNNLIDNKGFERIYHLLK